MRRAVIVTTQERHATMHAGFAIRAWLWTDLKASAYGWIPLALGLLIWDHFLRQESQSVMSEKIKDWVVLALLLVGFLPALAPLVPPRLPPPAPPLLTPA